MAVAVYQQQVLYTRQQLSLLRRLATGWIPPLGQCAMWQCIDRLHKKGAIAQRGSSLILTAEGEWAINRDAKRVMLYHKRSKGMDDELELASTGEAAMLDMEEVCEHMGHGNGGLDEAVSLDLVHDCLDYYKDNHSWPDPRDVQAWGEIVYVKVNIAQARQIVKAAEQEQSND